MKKTVPAFFKPLIPEGLQSKIRAAGKKASCILFRYECPICNNRIKSFLPYALKDFPVLREKNVVGSGYRRHMLCPTCGSYDRTRLLYLYLLHRTDIFKKPKKLLHLSPEHKLVEILQAKTNIDYLTADLLPETVMVKMDITNIEYSDDSFDAILCSHVLEHIPEDRKAMSELFRTLKPGGWAILQVPLSTVLENTYEDFSIQTVAGREEAFGQGDHVRIYAKDYVDRLQQAGFEVHTFKWKNERRNFGGRRNRFGLNEEECVYFARKQAIA